MAKKSVKTPELSAMRMPRTIPGFTAETCLYKTTERYQQEFAGVMTGNTVVPALRIIACHCYPCASSIDGGVIFCCDCRVVTV